MKKFKKKNPNKGILFWVTGLSGSGKTTLAKKIKREIQSLYGPTIVVSGDDIRRIFNFKKGIGRKVSGRKIFNSKKRITRAHKRTTRTNNHSQKDI